jgi:hypothetical protein
MRQITEEETKMRSKISALIFLVMLSLIINISYSNAKVPDWVKNLDSSEKYPAKLYLSGFGIATGQLADATGIAQESARGEVSRIIVVSINSMISSVREEKNDKYSQELSSITQSTTSLQDIKGINIDKFVDGDQKIATVYAFAYVSRADMKKVYAQEKQSLIQQINLIIKDAQTYESKSETMDAVTKYLSLYPIYEKLKEAEMILTVVGGSNSIQEAFSELEGEKQGSKLLMSQTEVSNNVDRLLSESLGSLNDVAMSVVMRLSKQVGTPSGKILVVPLTYQDTKMGSLFARQFRAELEQQVIQLANWKVAEQAKSFSPKSSQIMRDLAKESGAELILSGTYWERGNEVRLLINVRDINSGKVLAGTDLSFEASILPSNISIKPENYESALVAQGAFKEGEIVSGQLFVETWTNKGNDNVMYSSGETMKVYVRVNRETHIRLLYILADGRWTLLYDDLYIDSSKVNQAVEIPTEFECAPPFGAEMLVVIARTEPFEQMDAVEEDGYTFINKEPALPQSTARSLASTVRNEKGMKAKKQSFLATLDQNIKSDLSNEAPTEAIIKEFEKNKLSLSQNANISTLVVNSQWLITDPTNMLTYLIKQEEGKLNVYKIQQAETKLVVTTMEQ